MSDIITHYIVYDTATMEVLYGVDIRDSLVTTLEGVVPTGQAVAQHPKLPTLSSDYRYVFTPTGVVTEAVAKSLQTTKRDKLTLIKAQRTSVENKGFTWDSSQFDCDPTSQSRIQGAVQLAMMSISSSTSFSIDWTLADNSVRTLSASEMVQVGIAMGQHIITTHETYRTLKAAIEAATTAEEVAAVTWPTS
jgi:hypothetical protein